MAGQQPHGSGIPALKRSDGGSESEHEQSDLKQSPHTESDDDRLDENSVDPSQIGIFTHSASNVVYGPSGAIRYEPIGEDEEITHPAYATFRGSDSYQHGRGYDGRPHQGFVGAHTPGQQPHYIDNGNGSQGISRIPTGFPRGSVPYALGQEVLIDNVVYVPVHQGPVRGALPLRRASDFHPVQANVPAFVQPPTRRRGEPTSPQHNATRKNTRRATGPTFTPQQVRPSNALNVGVVGASRQPSGSGRSLDQQQAPARTGPARTPRGRAVSRLPRTNEEMRREAIARLKDEVAESKSQWREDGWKRYYDHSNWNEYPDGLPFPSNDIQGECHDHPLPETRRQQETRDFVPGIFPIDGYEDTYFEQWEPGSGKIHYNIKKKDGAWNVPEGTTCIFDANDIKNEAYRKQVIELYENLLWPRCHESESWDPQTLLRDKQGRLVLSPSFRGPMKNIPCIPLLMDDDKRSKKPMWHISGLVINILSHYMILYMDLASRMITQYALYPEDDELNNHPKLVDADQLPSDDLKPKKKEWQQKWTKLSLDKRRAQWYLHYVDKIMNWANMRAQRWRGEQGPIANPRNTQGRFSKLTLEIANRVWRSAPSSFLWGTVSEVYLDTKKMELALKIKGGLFVPPTNPELGPTETVEGELADILLQLGLPTLYLEGYVDMRDEDLSHVTEQYIPCLVRKTNAERLPSEGIVPGKEAAKKADKAPKRARASRASKRHEVKRHEVKRHEVKRHEVKDEVSDEGEDESTLLDNDDSGLEDDEPSELMQHVASRYNFDVEAADDESEEEETGYVPVATPPPAKRRTASGPVNQRSWFLSAQPEFGQAVQSSRPSAAGFSAQQPHRQSTLADVRMGHRHSVADLRGAGNAGRLFPPAAAAAAASAAAGARRFGASQSGTPGYTNPFEGIARMQRQPWRNPADSVARRAAQAGSESVGRPVSANPAANEQDETARRPLQVGGSGAAADEGAGTQQPRIQWDEVDFNDFVDFDPSQTGEMDCLDEKEDYN